MWQAMLVRCINYMDVPCLTNAITDTVPRRPVCKRARHRNTQKQIEEMSERGSCGLMRILRDEGTCHRA